MIAIIIILEVSITISIVLCILFVMYRQGQKQKLAALALLELLQKDKENKINNITKFLQNRLHFPDAIIKQTVQLFLNKELFVLQEIINLSSIDDKQLLQIYSKLQDLTLAYYTAKPPSALSEDKDFKPKTDYEGFLSECQAKFVKHLETKELIPADIRKQIHSFDKTNTQDN